MVVRDDVGVAVLGLVDLQVGELPGELLTRVDRLRRGREEGGEKEQKTGSG